MLCRPGGCAGWAQRIACSRRPSPSRANAASTSRPFAMNADAGFASASETSERRAHACAAVSSTFTRSPGTRSTGAGHATGTSASVVGGAGDAGAAAAAAARSSASLRSFSIKLCSRPPVSRRVPFTDIVRWDHLLPSGGRIQTSSVPPPMRDAAPKLLGLA